MNLSIETTNKFRAGDLENAYNDALNAKNKAQFIDKLQSNMPDTIIGVGGSHIWVSEKNGNRLGLIVNPLN